MRKNTLTAKQVQYMKPDSARRLEVPAGPPAGLYLVVHPTGKKAWAFRYRWNGATRKLTFDESYPDMTLAAARAEAESAREDLGNGIDPAVEYAEPKGSPDSVKAVVKEFIIRKVGGNEDAQGSGAHSYHRDSAFLEASPLYRRGQQSGCTSASRRHHRPGFPGHGQQDPVRGQAAVFLVS